MNKRAFGFALLCVLVVSLAGCKKDDDPTADSQAQTCYLSRLKSQFPGNTDWVTTDETVLDGSKRMIRANRYSSFVPGLLESYTEFQYNSAGQLQRTEEFSGTGAPGRYFTFEYNTQGQLTRQDEYVYDPATTSFEHQNYWTMEYNAANQLVKRINHQGGLGNYGTYEYDPAGNVIREAYYYVNAPGETPTLGDSYEHEYDNKKAFHTGYSTLKFNAFSLSKNNITKSTAYDGNNTIQPDQSFAYTYTYNAQGYPTEVSSSTFFAPTVYFVSQMEYACE